MIESLLLLAFGFLIAALGAIAMLPALWRRAVRLTRAHLEATLPLTPEEIAAEKDQMRAAQAVSIRQYELKLEASDASRQRAQAEAGQKLLTIHQQHESLTERAAHIIRLEQEKAAVTTDLASRDRELADTEQARQKLTETLAVSQAESRRKSEQIITLEREKKSMEERAMELQNQVQTLVSNLDKAQSEASVLRDEQHRTREELRISKDEVRALSREKQDAVQRLENLERTITATDLMAKQQNERLEAVQNERLTLMEKGERAIRDVANIQREKTALEERLNAALKRIESLELPPRGPHHHEEAAASISTTASMEKGANSAGDQPRRKSQKTMQK